MPEGADVFTYGTLLFPEVMAAVAGRAFASLPATLAGYARRGVRGAVYPAACACSGATIAGVLYLDVDATALGRLDRFEGAMYERRRLVVCDAGGRERDAETYVVAPDHAHRLDDTSWDPERFRREHLAAYLVRCRGGFVAEEHER